MKINDILNESTYNFINESKNITFPIKNIKDSIYHIGTMNIKDRSSRESHEGKSLSVSTEPNAWAKINKGFTGGDLWLLNKKNNKFVDMVKIDNDIWDQLYSWGEQSGYFKQQTMYKYCYYDDEMDDTLCQEFDTYEEALAEVIDDDEKDNIEKVSGAYIPTEKFKKETGTVFHKDLIVAIYCINKNINVDGLWWDEKLDILRYSAPRGNIFDHIVHTWNIKKVNEE